LQEKQETLFKEAREQQQSQQGSMKTSPEVEEMGNLERKINKKAKR